MSRPQPYSDVIGTWNRPEEARGPNVISAIRQPDRTMSSGEIRRAVAAMAKSFLVVPQASEAGRECQTLKCNYTHHSLECPRRAAAMPMVEAGSGLSGPQLVEDVPADHVHFLQAPGPGRPDVIRMIMGRAAHIRHVGSALENRIRDPLRGVPGFTVGDAQGPALAGEGELAGQVPVPVLVDDAADRGRVETAFHPVEHHLGDRRLPFLRLAARLEIHRLGKAALLGVHLVRIDEFGVARAFRVGPRRDRGVLLSGPAEASRPVEA